MICWPSALSPLTCERFHRRFRRELAECRKGKVVQELFFPLYSTAFCLLRFLCVCGDVQAPDALKSLTGEVAESANNKLLIIGAI